MLLPDNGRDLVGSLLVAELVVFSFPFLLLLAFLVTVVTIGLLGGWGRLVVACGVFVVLHGPVPL